MSTGATGAAPAANCKKCGNATEVGARFCTACGAAIGSIEAPASAASDAPGKDLFVEAIKLSLEKGSGIPAMPLLQKALALGLAPEEEAFARLSLGEGYREIFGNSDLPWQKMIETNEFHQCMTEIEKAFQLDREGPLGFFSQPLNIGRLQNLDLMYTLAAQAKQEQQGTDSAVAYLVGKLAAVEYLQRPPLLASLAQLGDLYRQKGDLRDAVRVLNKVLDTEPLYPADEERNTEVRDRARKTLSEVQSQSKQSAEAPGAFPSHKRGTNMTETTADVHLKRAYGFIKEVEKATEDFRERAVAHDAQVESDQPFLQGMVSTITGSKQLKQHKATLVNDLQLANQEIDRAVAVDVNAAIETADGTFGGIHLRAFSTFMSGQLEMIWGRSEDAKYC